MCVCVCVCVCVCERERERERERMCVFMIECLYVHAVVNSMPSTAHNAKYYSVNQPIIVSTHCASAWSDYKHIHHILSQL